MITYFIQVMKEKNSFQVNISQSLGDYGQL